MDVSVIKTQLIFFLFFSVLILLQFIFQMPNLFNTLSLFTFLFYLFLLLKNKKIETCIYFQLLFAILCAVIPEWLFEIYPVYLAELSEVSYSTGGITRQILYQFILIATSFLIFSYRFKAIDIEVRKPSKRMLYMMYAFLFVIFAISLYGFTIYGTAISNQMFRFEYWSDVVTNPVVKLAHSFYVIASLILSIIYLWKPRIAIVGFIFLLLFTIMGGDKFTPFMTYLIWFIAVIYITGRLSKKLLKKIALLLILFLFMISVLVVYHYSDLLGNTTIPVFELVLGRIAAQGQVWWGVDKIVEISLYPNAIDDFFKEISLFFSSADLYDKDSVGMYRVMNLISTNDRVTKYLFSGIRFTEGWPGVGLWYFGYVWLALVQVLAGAIYGIWGRYMYKAIRYSDFIMCILLMKLGQNITEAFVMGNMYVLFGISTVICISLIFIYRWASKAFHYNGNNRRDENVFYNKS